MKKLICAVLALALLLAIPLTITSCKEEDEVPNYYADIEIENYGTITVKLYGKQAPITVNNFVNLAKSGFYDGLTFHRIIEGFMIQGGGGKQVPTIKGEFAENGVQNDIKHVRGTVSMARAQDMNSASSQFFICQGSYDYGNGRYAAFGEVIEGMTVVDAIATCEVEGDAQSPAPVETVVIESVTFVEPK
jgi:peptidyl-prolyl cis-trans isomerase B (cyclophilin B)